MFKNKPVITASLLVAVTSFLFFLPVVGYDFIIQDDSIYVVVNPLIRNLGWHTVVQAFGKAHFGWWMPLTWLSFALDYHFWGLDPFGYHLHNVILHAINAALAVLIADLLCRERFFGREGEGVSAALYTGFLLFTGLLFGLHPLRVESVAWVAERKDVLNGLFAFSSILLYLLYARAAVSGSRRRLYYLGSLALFALSLMAKSSSVGLSLMLLVLDWYPLGRLRRETVKTLLLEKLPFIAVSAASAAATLFLVRENAALVTFEAFPFSQRLSVSGNAIWEYWRLFILPFGLTPLHVIPDPIPLSYDFKAAAVALLLAGTFFASRLDWLKATLLCFILPVFPVLGFFQNGDQAYAARFTYLAALAQTITVAALLFCLVLHGRSVTWRRLSAVAAALFLLMSIGVSLSLFPDWRNTESYWSSIIAREPLAINYKERGRHYFTTGRYDAAIADFTSALDAMSETLKPYAYNFYAFRAEAYRMSGLQAEAVTDFTTAIAALPHPVYFHHRGLALQAMGRSAEAAEDFKRAGANPGPVAWFD